MSRGTSWGIFGGSVVIAGHLSLCALGLMSIAVALRLVLVSVILAIWFFLPLLVVRTVFPAEPDRLRSRKRHGIRQR
jgi:hypothetical protein